MNNRRGSGLAAQLAYNPQFKEIGDQLREDLRGVGKSATGALLDRRIEGITDRLHDRTLDVEDRISGVVPDVPGSAECENEVEDETEGEGLADEKGKASTKSPSRSRSGSEGSGREGSSGEGSGREGASSAKSRTAGRAVVIPEGAGSVNGGFSAGCSRFRA